MTIDPDEFIVPDFTEEFVGWRGWQVTGDGLLEAIVNPEASCWHPGQALSAVCTKNKRHPVPFMNCTCGFYATKTLAQLIDNDYHTSGAFGTVSLWGKSIQFTDGYRAQFAYPREIWIPYTMLKFVEPLARYGVPVRLANPWTATEETLRNGNRKA
jgi:hypothetical protein